jgi:hypothetical protein
MNEKKFNQDKWQTEMKKLKSEQMRENLAKSGRYPFLQLKEGKNKVKLLNEQPREMTSNYGKKQVVYQVIKDGNKFDWPITISSPLFDVVTFKKMPKAPIELTIVRKGRGLETRLRIVD